jgi:bifunctional DNA-binding transcriptional regulator/antitoxin component of YhaV-PrlF toxin-antitoxin module
MGVFQYEQDGSGGDQDSKPSKKPVSVNQNNGSLRTVIPKAHAEHLGIDEGQVMAEVTDEGVILKPL